MDQVDQLLAVVQANWKIISIAAGPLTLCLVLRMIFGKNRMLFMLVNGSAAWLAIRVLLMPYMDLAKKNVQYLGQISGQ
jgi:hypothetical protein